MAAQPPPTKRVVDQAKLHGLDIDETQMTQQVRAQRDMDRSIDRSTGAGTVGAATRWSAVLSSAAAIFLSVFASALCVSCVRLQDLEFVAFTQRSAILNIFGGAAIGFGLPFLASTTTQRMTHALAHGRIRPPSAER